MAVSKRLEEDLRSEEVQHGVGQQFWRLVDCVGDLLFFELAARDGTKYLIRLDCADYGDEPIEGKFVDAATRT